MRRLLAWGAAILIATLAGGPAHAAWIEASTPHFVIDADTGEPRIRDFATRLERYDAALRKLYGITDTPLSTSERVRVFAVPVGDILRSCHGCPQGTRGFYHSSVGGPVIFTATLSRTTDGKDLDLDAQEVLLHEYAHHFMYANFPGAWPMWFTEGFAEFNGNIRFQPDGGVVLGTPANYRAIGLRTATLPARSLFQPSRAALADPRQLDLIYGRGWLLMHWLMLSNERRPQLAAYQKAIEAGVPSLTAAERAFGDLRKLDRTLDTYMGGRLESPFLIPPGPAPAITIAPLSPGATAMMPVHIRSTAGVDAKTAAAIFPDAERRAAPFPADARVQDELAEAAFDADRNAVADAAATRALAADPGDVRAMLYRGRVAARLLTGAKSHDADGWKAARRWFVRANRTDTEAPLPLALYYLSFRAEGVAPPSIAVDGLFKAQKLAPYDPTLRILLALHLLDEGDGASARTLLGPVAYAPHQKDEANPARAAIDLIDAGKPGDARNALAGADTTPFL